MEEIVNKLKHLNKISFRGPIGMFIVVASFLFLFFLLYKAIPTDNKDVVLFAAGLVLGMAGNVTNWYFGSSKEKADQEKSQQVKELLSNDKSSE